MSKKGSNFFEEHVEKIVLGAIGVVCLWFLITRVIISPNVVEYENKKLSAARVDEQLEQQAELLEDKISQKPKETKAYKAQIDAFAAKFNSAIGNIDSNLSLPLPASTDIQVSDRRFAMPAIGQIKGIDAEHIRAVAFVPKAAINMENSYEDVETEPNDVDLVTVEGKFDVAGLYERFYANFAGDNVPNEQWRDPCLAIPIFAAVQLQRQEMLPDANWSDWKIVPRTQIDQRKKLFELVEDVRKLPAGGVRIRLLQFNDPVLRRELLQPGGYKISSVGEEWYPPSLHREFLKDQQGRRAQEKHEAKIASKEKVKDEGRSSSRQRTDTRTRVAKGASEDGGGGGISITGSSAPKRASVTKSRPERQSEEAPKIVIDVPTKFNELLLSPTTDLSRMSGPLDFWAIDDTVQAGKTYRYRMRLGFFNPVAGTDQFQDKDKHFQNDVVLWSDFSEVTKNIEIPAILYFFPRDIQEAAGAVTVQVSKYVFGNWYSKDFMVKKGEVIGRVARTEVKEENPDVFVPESINYDTGAVVVDIVPVNDLSSSKGLRSRSYYDMLYSFDGTKIEHMPIKTMNWDDKMQAKFNEIKRASKEPKVALRGWKGTAAQQMQQKGGIITIQGAGD